MAICPKCDNEIKELIHEEEITIEQKYKIGGIYETGEYSEEVKKPITEGFLCPICRQKICKYESEAETLLKEDPIHIIERIINKNKIEGLSKERTLELLKEVLK